jgi:hypothetical protein
MGLEDPPAVAAADISRERIAFASWLNERLPILLESYKTGTDSVHDKASTCLN